MVNYKEKDWRLLQYNIPIRQSYASKGNFIIKGTAINSTITRNAVEFLSEELMSSAESLIGKPLLKDHNNSVDSVIGKVIDAFFNPDTQSVDFEAIVIDRAMQDKIKAGLVNKVSIGANVEDLEMDENQQHYIARGIDFVELSLVAVPADPNAGFNHVVAEAYNIKKEKESAITWNGVQDTLEQSNQVKGIPKEDNKANEKMAEKNEKTETVEKVEQKSETSDVMAKTLETLTASIQSLADNNKVIMQRLEEMEAKKVEQSIETEEVKEEPKEEPKEEKVEQKTKGMISDEVAEKIEASYSNLEIKRSTAGMGYDISMSSYANTKRMNGTSNNPFVNVGGSN